MKQIISPLLQIGICAVGCLYATSNGTLAQVTSDGTLDTEVNQNGNVAEITGGETRGSNLFHSFQDFSVPTNNTAFFNNGLGVSNIFSRVTGGNISNIDGAIRANGSASLFLINPAGIIFGEGARLDIGGSFYGSSASSILFENGEFNAADLENPPILTINAPIGLGFRDNPKEIINRSRVDSAGLQVAIGEDIALLGGDINLEGGLITVSEGKITLGGLNNAGEIGITGINGFTFPEELTKSNVSLTQQAEVDVRGAVGGSIQVNANNLNVLENSNFLAGISLNSGTLNAQSGDINFNLNNLIAAGDAKIRNETLGIGNAGNINIATSNIDFIEGSAIISSTLGQGNAGNVTIDSSEDVAFESDLGGIYSTLGLQRDDTEVEGTIGNAGDININARSFTLNDGARLVTNTVGNGNAGNITINVTETALINGTAINPFKTAILSQAKANGIGNAGNININANNFELNNASLIGADSETLGNAGTIDINASERVILGIDTLVLTQIQSDAEGDGGNIQIDTKNLNLVDSFVLSDSKGRGDAGSIIINATESILIEDSPNTDTTVFPEGSLIISGVGILGDETEGNAGNIEITTKSLTSNGSSFIVAQTNGIGDGGDIIIQSQDGVFLNGSSRIVSQVQESAIGDGGEIIITSPTIDLNGLSAISTTTLAGGQGTAGNISLNTNNLTLTDNAIIDALTENDFNGGNITISANNINLLSGSKIVTATDSGGSAGNINLDVSETINIAGEDLNFSQFITELVQNEILRNDEDDQTQPDDRFRFVIPSGTLEVLGSSSGLFANTSVNSTGNSGNITIENSQQFNLADAAVISVGSEGNGSAGSLSIQSQSLSLNDGSLLAATPVDVGGNIALSITENLTLRNTSLISSQATKNANGGNIGIDANFIIAFPNGNNDIIANAQQGRGGNISINVESLFGIQQRSPNDSTNDINASSEVSGLDGTVDITTPDINPVQGATELPTNVVEPGETTQQACQANRETAAKNGLTISGKGGIIPDPGLALNSLNVTVNGETNPTSIIPTPIETSQGKIQPARGIKVTESGEVILTAYRTNNSGERIPSSSANCDRV